jgi:hypothetical protein
MLVEPGFPAGTFISPMLIAEPVPITIGSYQEGGNQKGGESAIPVIISQKKAVLFRRPFLINI